MIFDGVPVRTPSLIGRSSVPGTSCSLELKIF